MAQSSCLCGAIKLNLSGEVVAKFICHCLDDRKITGTLYSHNIVVPESSIEHFQGTFKTYSKVVETGNVMTNYFCGDCGGLLYRASSGIPGVVAIKVGMIDDIGASEAHRPVLEQFTRNRVSWQPAVPGAEQVHGPWVPSGL